MREIPFEPPRAGLKSYSAAHTQIVMGLVYNTKRVTAKPTSFMELGSAKYKGKIGIPAYGFAPMLLSPDQYEPVVAFLRGAT